MQFGGADGLGTSVRMADQCNVSRIELMSERSDILDQEIEFISTPRLLGLPKTTPGEADAMIPRCKLRARSLKTCR